jgi:biotin carboxyl carrier protein
VWIFPILRLLAITAIAVALVKVAFYPDTAVADDPAQPSAELTEPQLPVSLGTITNDVVVPATVNADAAVPVRATALGTVDEVFATVGQAVATGDKLYDIKVETPRDPVESTDAAGQVTVTQPKPAVTFVKVLATAAGTVSALTVIHGQSVAIGDTTGQLAPPTFSVSGSLSPEQQYRLVNRPTEASIAITNGPAPFTCTGLSITTPLAGATGGGTSGSDGTGGSTGSVSGGTTTTVTCAVPTGVTVFPGLAAQMTLAGGKAENVLVVPTTAVRGTAETGVVWFVTPDGTTEERPVTLGLTDGTNVEVRTGLVAGDLIDQFVPGAVDPATDGCQVLPDGSKFCSAPGASAGVAG